MRIKKKWLVTTYLIDFMALIGVIDSNLETVTWCNSLSSVLRVLEQQVSDHCRGCGQLSLADPFTMVGAVAPTQMLSPGTCCTPRTPPCVHWPRDPCAGTQHLPCLKPDAHPLLSPLSSR